MDIDPRQPAKTIQDFTRRQWIKGGGALAGSLLWPRLLQANPDASAKRCILIYLQGGLSHYESFDPKPNAPSAYRGEFGTIRTSIPGIHFSEHLPKLAKRAHKFNLIRSAYVDSPSHPVAIYQTLTGVPLAAANVTGTNRNYVHPSVGSWVAKTFAGKTKGLPPYVAIPHSGQLGIRVHFASSGSLGAEFEPMESGMTPDTAKAPYLAPQSLAQSRENPLSRIHGRFGLLNTLEGQQNLPESVTGLGDYHRHAAEMISSGKAAQAFDLNQEPAKARERYGDHLWGQQTLLARRMAEADVPFTLLNYTLDQERGQDWDTHKDNFNIMRDVLLPPMDHSVSILLDDLEERGLLGTTLVAMYGEFGRTPKINRDAGRDHWEKVFSIFLAGGGLKSGVILGSSTTAGDVPKDRPVHFNEVLATIYHQLGVPLVDSVMAPDGRPIPILTSGKPIAELIA